MREFKFRAFDKKGDGMFYDIQNGIKFDDGSHYTFDKFLFPQSDDVHDWVVMQFTGLKDKNGKEIYEGDIVKMAEWNSPTEFRSDDSHHRIFWDDKEARFWDERLEDGDSLAGYQNHSIDWVSDGKVIGNIYEHPELLES